MSFTTHEATPTLAGLLQNAGVTKSAVIHVAGAGALPTLLWLCAQGYAGVAHLRSLRTRALDACDVLIIGRPCDAFELKRTLHLARRLRPGALLVAPLHADLRTAGGAVERLLRDAGFLAEHHPLDGRAALLVARRQADMKKAA
jgi:hypothetical protein